MSMREKNSSVSEQTKQQLASALKTLMAQKPMDKITIEQNRCAMACGGCGVAIFSFL